MDSSEVSRIISEGVKRDMEVLGNGLFTSSPGDHSRDRIHHDQVGCAVGAATVEDDRSHDVRSCMDHRRKAQGVHEEGSRHAVVGKAHRGTGDVEADSHRMEGDHEQEVGNDHSDLGIHSILGGAVASALGSFEESNHEVVHGAHSSHHSHLDGHIHAGNVGAIENDNDRGDVPVGSGDR